MIQFYYNLAPNPMKVALCLEEMGLPYELHPVDGRKGEQHAPAYLEINPNAKVPSIIDGEATVFDSNDAKEGAQAFVAKRRPCWTGT